MSATWAQLAELRANGLQPSMKVVVTTSNRFAWGMDQIGVMAILHKSGEPFPVELLDGLDVWLVLDDCSQAESVLRLMRLRDIKPESYLSWCKCQQTMTTLVMGCTEQLRSAAWINNRKTA